MEVNTDVKNVDQDAACGGPMCGCCLRNWKVLVPVVLLLVILLGGMLVYQELIGSQKSSEPYRMALEQVQSDPKVIQRLGKPIDDTWRVGGDVFTEGDRGEANLNFEVLGPQGKGRVRTQARRIDGQWGLTTLEVTFDDGQRISLETKAGEGLDDAPAWSP